MIVFLFPSRIGENTWADKKVVMLFRRLYAPQSEEEYLRFPLLDMLVANMEYKEDDYASFLQQCNLPLTLSMVFVGNTKHTVPYMLKNSHLFESMPTSFIKGAFLDRIHLYNPGWEIRTLI